MFPRSQDLTFHANCLRWWRSAWNVKFGFLGKIRKYISNFHLQKFYPECEAMKRLMKGHLSALFSGRSKKMSSVFICQARSLFIELLICCWFGDEKKLIVLTYLRILCKRIVLAIISIPSLPDLLLTYSGLLGYIMVNLFSTFRTFNYIDLPRKKGWIFYWSLQMKTVSEFQQTTKGLLHGIGNLHWFLPTLGIGWNSTQWLPRV